MLKLKRRNCKICGKPALQNRTICWKHHLEAQRASREASQARQKARKQAAKATKQARSALSKKNLDILWSKATKAHYGQVCEVCGSPNNLNSHHIFRRTIFAVRWDYRNCSVLCANCHMFNNDFSAHATPTAFSDWIKQKRGKDWYSDLLFRSRSSSLDRKYFLEELKTLF